MPNAELEQTEPVSDAEKIAAGLFAIADAIASMREDVFRLAWSGMKIAEILQENQKKSGPW